MTKWGAFLVVLFVFAMLMLTVGMLIQVSKAGKDLNKPESADVIEVSGTIFLGNSGGWELIPNSGGGGYLLRNLPGELRSVGCRSCQFVAELKILVFEKRLKSSRYKADVVEVLSIKKLPCDHCKKN